MDQLTVSIAMCTYNGQRYLREQLESLSAQSLRPLELVACDDGSTDETIEILRRFAQSAGFPVRVVRNEVNLGVTANFEKAIRLCQGNLIALCDQDDYWKPEKLEKAAALLSSRHDLGGVFSDGLIMDAESNLTGATLWQSYSFGPPEVRQFESGEAARILLKDNVVTGAALVFRREILKDVLPIPLSWWHDAWIAWILVARSRLAPCRAPLIHYRMHSSQQTGVPMPFWRRSVRLVREKGVRLQGMMRRAGERHPRQYAEMNAQFLELAHRVQQLGSEFELLREAASEKAAFAARLQRLLTASRWQRSARLVRELPNYTRYTSHPLERMLWDALI